MGSGPAGVMTAIVMNNRGELVVPGIITGTFDNPKFESDKEQITLSKLKGILPTSKNPAGLLGTLFQANHHKSTDSVLPRLNPATEIENVFGRILRKKK